MNGHSNARSLSLLAIVVILAAVPTEAQNRGVYPLGMTALNSGVTPEPGYTYANQLLYYARDDAKGQNGETTATGANAVVLDMNTFAWVTPKTLAGARYSTAATIPIASNSLTSDIHGAISGGTGIGDSYFLPVILGWGSEHAAVRAMYGFLAPTGRFKPEANDNVGSGYWSHAVSSGQTFYPTQNRRLAVSAFQMYEWHTTQEGTGVHPGDTFNLDYSVMGAVARTVSTQLHVGLVGYEARQTTAKSGPNVAAQSMDDRYGVNALGFAVNAVFPKQKASLGVKYFKEFADRSTFQGYSLQVAGAIGF